METTQMIDSREAFEEKFGKPEHWIDFDESKNKYVCKYNSIDHHLLIYQARWEAWQASANREGYKLVPVKATDEQVKKAEQLYIVECMSIFDAVINAID